MTTTKHRLPLPREPYTWADRWLKRVFAGYCLLAAFSMGALAQAWPAHQSPLALATIAAALAGMVLSLFGARLRRRYYYVSDFGAQEDTATLGRVHFFVEHASGESCEFVETKPGAFYRRDRVIAAREEMSVTIVARSNLDPRKQFHVVVTSKLTTPLTTLTARAVLRLHKLYGSCLALTDDKEALCNLARTSFNLDPAFEVRAEVHELSPLPSDS